MSHNQLIGSGSKKNQQKVIRIIFFLLAIVFILLIIEGFLIFIFLSKKEKQPIQVNVQGATEQENKNLENYLNQ